MAFGLDASEFSFGFLPVLASLISAWTCNTAGFSNKTPKDHSLTSRNDLYCSPCFSGGLIPRVTEVSLHEKPKHTIVRH